MKNLTAKQEARHEKKKKKIAALAQIIKINDRDGRQRTPPCHSGPSNTNSDSDNASKDMRQQQQQQDKPPVAVNNAKLAQINRPTSRDSHTSNHTNSEPSIKRLRRNIDTEQPTADANDAPPSPISTLDYAAIKRTVNSRKHADRSKPKIRLKLMGDCAMLSNHTDNRTPIFLTDIQHLVMATVLGSGSPCSPHRWCHIERSAKVPHVVVLVVEGE